MNRNLIGIAALVVLVSACGLARGQTLIDLRTQTKSVDFTGAAFTKPFKSGISLPLTCGVGEAFYNIAAVAGLNFYTCTTANVWTLQSGVRLPDPTGSANSVLTTNGVNPGWSAIGGDISGTVQNMRVGALQGRIVSTTTPGDGQVLRWNNAVQDWEPGTVTSASGVASGLSNYSKSFQALTLLSIAGTEHNYGTSNLIVACYDNTVAPWIRIEPDSMTVDGTSFNVVIKFAQAQSGVCVVNGSGGGTPITVAGDVTGTSASSVVKGLQGFAVASSAPSDSQVLTWSAAAQQWQAAPPQGGGGTSGSSTINSLSVTYQSATSFTIGSTCTLLLPCNVRFGSTVYSFSGSAAVTVQGGSGTVYFYVANNGILTAASANVTIACSAGCLTLGLDGYPPSSIPLATWTANGGVVDVAGDHDNRAFLSSKALAAGLGVVVIDSGSQSTVSVDAAVVPTYLAAIASLSFPLILNGACSAELTIPLIGANSGDSVASGWPPSMPQGVLGMMRVSATGIVAVRICNFSGTAVTPQADTYRATVVRSL